jgi:hypothetical protein
MVKDPSTFGLKPEKLGRILKVCSEGSQNKGKMTSKEQKEELLQDRLSETLLTFSPKDGGLLKELKHLCRVSGLLAGEPIRNLLVGPNTDVELLEKVKQHGKKLSQSASCEAEHETANVIYYASIASALVFHGLKITKFSYENLNRAFDIFVKTPWIDTDLSTLFNKASMYCQKKLDSSNKD